MTHRGRTLRPFVTLIAILALAAGTLGFAPDPGRLAAADAASLGGAPAAPEVGEDDLFNFAHVANFPMPVEDGNGQSGLDQQGTDMEFFTSDVPVRDAAGAVVLDPEGAPVIATRDFAVVGGYNRGAYIYDITDPEATFQAAFIPCAQPRNDVGVQKRINADGSVQILMGLSREGGPVCDQAGESFPIGAPAQSGGIAMFDISDPVAWEPAGRVQVPVGAAHNIIFHPSKPAAYVWNGELVGTAYAVSTIQIVDLTDLADIKVTVGPQTFSSPHDGELSPDGDTMYVASGTNYEIFDNTDPFNPVRISDFVPNPGTYGHGYFPSPDGTIAITNNESLALGGFFAGGTGICPGEGLAFYDTSDPQAVIGPLSVYVPPVYGRTDARACTSHFGRVAANGKVMVVGWYILGGRVVDFSDPTLPLEIGAAAFGADRGEAWTAKTYGEAPYMYVGDQGRGFDVFRWTGDPECGVPWAENYVTGCLDARLPGVPTSQLLNLGPQTAAVGVLGERRGFSCQL